MAASLNGGRAVAKAIGRRILRQTWMSSGRDSTRRAVQSSAYDKIPEETVEANAVPDHLVEQKSGECWGPDPRTGVFGPAGRTEELGSLPAEGGTALDQDTWFRPLEDVQKPPPY